MWHRQYACPAHDHLRRDRVGARLKQCAERVKDKGILSERFARGIFPDPQSLFELPEVQEGTSWHNRHPSGVLSGLIFLDGSAKWANLEGMSRAGWAICSVDRFGNLISAVYGVVPVSAAPQQTSKDGEDYAVYMLTRVGIPPFQCYIDCQSTLDSLARGPGFSEGPGAPTA